MTINLLTGREYDRMVTDSAPRIAIETPWGAEKYLSAMRRLLNEASKPSQNGDVAHLVAAAGVLAQAATAAALVEDSTCLQSDTDLPGPGDTIR